MAFPTEGVFEWVNRSIEDERSDLWRTIKREKYQTTVTLPPVGGQEGLRLVDTPQYTLVVDYGSSSSQYWRVDPPVVFKALPNRRIDGVYLVDVRLGSEDNGSELSACVAYLYNYRVRPNTQEPERLPRLCNLLSYTHTSAVFPASRGENYYQMPSNIVLIS